MEASMTIDSVIQVWCSLKEEYELQQTILANAVNGYSPADIEALKAHVDCEHELVVAGLKVLEGFRSSLAEQEDEPLVGTLESACSERCMRGIMLHQRLTSTGSSPETNRDDVLEELQELGREMETDIRSGCEALSTARALLSEVKKKAGKRRLSQLQDHRSRTLDPTMQSILDGAIALQENQNNLQGLGDKIHQAENDTGLSLLDDLAELATRRFDRIAKRYTGYQAMTDSLPRMLEVALEISNRVPNGLAPAVSWLADVAVANPVRRFLDRQQSNRRAVTLWVAGHVIPLTLVPACASFASTTRLDIRAAEKQIEALREAAPS
jgi:hypothetical protein